MISNSHLAEDLAKQGDIYSTAMALYVSYNADTTAQF